MSTVTVDRGKTSTPRLARDERLPGDPLDLAGLARWPCPAERVDFVDGLAWVHAARGRYTVGDLAHAPDDGRRYELCDGLVVVSPSPGYAHQLAVARLLVLLTQAQPSEMRILPAPYDITLDDGRVFQPDIVVLPKPEAPFPLLVVEVLSRYGRGYDTRNKFEAYQDAGVPSYWIVDPERPSVTVFDLAGDHYAQESRAVGDERCVVRQPFPVSFRPADLVD